LIEIFVLSITGLESVGVVMGVSKIECSSIRQTCMQIEAAVIMACRERKRIALHD
jgi:hypothetical protein